MLRVERTDEGGWPALSAALMDPAFLAAVTRTPVPQQDHGPRIAEIRQQQAQIVTRAVTHHMPDQVVTAALAPLALELELERGSQPPKPESTPDMTEPAGPLADYLPTLTTLEERQAALSTSKSRLLFSAQGVERLTVEVHQGVPAV